MEELMYNPLENKIAVFNDNNICCYIAQPSI